jgi:hypothetical protein
MLWRNGSVVRIKYGRRNHCATALLINLVQYHGCPVGDLRVQPCDIVGIHVDTTMTPIAVETRCPACIIVREVIAGAKVDSPPCIVEEVATFMIFQRVLDIGIGIPESGSWRLARFEYCRRLAQDDAPFSRR